MRSPFTLDGTEHEPGNPDCSECWPDYPEKHKGCTGLMHAAFGDENYDCDYWLYYKCDVCGESE